MGHSDLHCPAPGSRDEHGNLQWGAYLQAPEDYKQPASNDNFSKEQAQKTSSHRESKNSSSHGEKGAGVEVNSPTKKSQQQKWKGAPEQVYRPVANKSLMITMGAATSTTVGELAGDKGTVDTDDSVVEREPKKKKPTPKNSAEAAGQPCPSQ